MIEATDIIEQQAVALLEKTIVHVNKVGQKVTEVVQGICDGECGEGAMSALVGVIVLKTMYDLMISNTPELEASVAIYFANVELIRDPK